ncbi:MAG: hypothetical protein KC619_28395 [Myxococcales bacterium]|nr:hypothetical protein [Myxococcales bacterium]
MPLNLDLKQRILAAATAALGLSACSSADEAPAEEAPITDTSGTESEAAALPEPSAATPTPAEQPAEAEPADEPLNMMDGDSEARSQTRHRASPSREAPPPPTNPSQGAAPGAEASCGASCGAECGGVPGEDEESGGDPAPQP